LEHEIVGESVGITFDRAVERASANSVKFGKVIVEHNP
jgi:hypothetical protein